MKKAKKAIKKCKKEQIEQAEAFYQETKQKEIQIEGTEIKYTKQTQNNGIGIRIIKNNKLGFASTSDLDKIEETIKQAIKNSKINNLKLKEFAKNQKYPKINNIYDKKTEQNQINNLINDAKQLIEATNQKNVKPTNGSINQSTTKTTIANTNGVTETYKKTTITASIEALAKSEKESTTAHNQETKISKKELDIKEIAKEARETAKNSLGPKEKPSGQKSVILHPYTIAALFESTIIPSLSAEEIQKNRSRIPEYMDKQIGPKEMTIKDNGTKDNSIASKPFDDEGTATKEREIIKKGELKNIYHNLKTSQRAKEKSTGNASRNNYTETPGIAPNNFIIKTKDPRENIEEENDLIIRTVLGAHTANKLTGDFSLGIKNGYIIQEDGKKPINQSMVSGNIYELIRNIESIGKEKRTVGKIKTPKIKTKLTIS